MRRGPRARGREPGARESSLQLSRGQAPLREDRVSRRDDAGDGLSARARRARVSPGGRLASRARFGARVWILRRRRSRARDHSRALPQGRARRVLVAIGELAFVLLDVCAEAALVWSRVGSSRVWWSSSVHVRACARVGRAGRGFPTRAARAATPTPRRAATPHPRAARSKTHAAAFFLGLCLTTAWMLRRRGGGRIFRRDAPTLAARAAWVGGVWGCAGLPGGAPRASIWAALVAQGAARGTKGR